MRRILTLAASLAMFGALALADSWTGTLFDATCVQQQKSAKGCEPTGTTTAFVVHIDGRMYQLDDAGNAKAVEALKSRADRSSNPSAPQSTMVQAKITGTREGPIIKVETLEVQ